MKFLLLFLFVFNTQHFEPIKKDFGFYLITSGYYEVTVGDNTQSKEITKEDQYYLVVGMSNVNIINVNDCIGKLQYKNGSWSASCKTTGFTIDFPYINLYYETKGTIILIGDTIELEMEKMVYYPSSKTKVYHYWNVTATFDGGKTQRVVP